MREFMSARIAGDVEKVRHRHWRAKVAKAKAASVVKVLNRHRDVPACKGCGYQKCSCPPEPVEEDGEPRAPFWNDNGQYAYSARLGSAAIGDVTEFNAGFRGVYYGDDTNRWEWGDTEVEARAWVEAQHAAQAGPVEVKAAGEWVTEKQTSYCQEAYRDARGRFLGKVHASQRTSLLGQYYAYAVGSVCRTCYFDTEAEAKAWVEEACS